jgi:hypothetical protein
MLLVMSLISAAYVILSSICIILVKHKSTNNMDEKFSGKERITILNQLHIAEYQALTTRGSYWIVLQFGLIPVVPIYLTLAVGVWVSNVIIKEVVIWSTLAGLQIIALLWAEALVENYTAVRYIECYLRPRISDGLDTSMFWGYEPYLVLNRVANAGWFELMLPAVGTIVLIGIFIMRILQTFSWWDVSFGIFNIILLAILWIFTLKARRMRIEWSTFDKGIVQALAKERNKVAILEP